MPHQYENGKPMGQINCHVIWKAVFYPLFILPAKKSSLKKMACLFNCFLFNFMFWKTTWKWFPFTDGGQFPYFPFLWENYETKNNSPKEKTDIMEKKSWHQYMFLLYCHLCLCSHEHSIQFVYSACQKWIDICRRRIEFKWNNQKIS